MERFAWFLDEITAQVSRLKGAVLAALHVVPVLGNLRDSQLEWIFIGLIFIVAAFVIYPLIKISLKISIGAVAIAALLAFLTSYSFWGVLPFTGLGVAIVLFSNRFQMG